MLYWYKGTNTDADAPALRQTDAELRAALASLDAKKEELLVLSLLSLLALLVELLGLSSLSLLALLEELLVLSVPALLALKSTNTLLVQTYKY